MPGRFAASFPGSVFQDAKALQMLAQSPAHQFGAIDFLSLRRIVSRSKQFRVQHYSNGLQFFTMRNRATNTICFFASLNEWNATRTVPSSNTVAEGYPICRYPESITAFDPAILRVS